MVELYDSTFDKAVMAPDAGVWFLRFYAPVSSLVWTHNWCSGVDTDGSRTLESIKDFALNLLVSSLCIIVGILTKKPMLFLACLSF